MIVACRKIRSVLFSLCIIVAEAAIGEAATEAKATVTPNVVGEKDPRYEEWLRGNDKLHQPAFLTLAVPVVGMAFQNNDTRFMAVRSDGSVEQWQLGDIRPFRRGPDVGTKASDRTGAVVNDTDVIKVHSANNGEVVVTTCSEGGVWRLGSWKEDRWVKLPSGCSPRTSSLSGDGKWYAYSTKYDGVVMVVDTENRRESCMPAIGNNDTYLVALSPNGKKCATYASICSADPENASDYKYEIKLWDVGVTSNPTFLNGATGGVSSLVWVTDSQLLAASGAGELMLWDIQKPKEPTFIKTDFDSVIGLEISRKERLVAFRSNVPDRMEIMSLTNNLVRSVFDLHCDGIRAITFSNNGKLIGVGGGDGSIRILRTDRLETRK
jgi:WD40 repeat protein